MSKFTMVSIAGDRFGADTVTAGVYEADSAEDVVKQFAAANDIEDEGLAELLEMTSDEGDHWSVWQEETNHFIVKVD